LSDPKVLERKAERLADKKIQSRLIETKTKDFIDKLWMSDEEKENFLESFEERKQLKSFKLDDIDKHLEKAYREISDNEEVIKKLKANEIIGKSIWTNEWKWGKSDWKPSDWWLNSEISSFLKQYL